MKFFNLKQTSENEVEIRIDGDIIPDEYKYFYEWFNDPFTSPKVFRDMLKKYEGKNLTVWINSPGGDIIAGAAIYTALKEFKGKKTIKIDGCAASIASVIAMAGDEILMSPTSLMFIHDPWGQFEGNANELQKGIEALNVCKEIIINAYEQKTGLPREKLSKMMEDETWFSPQQAIENKFADGVLYESEEKPDYKNMIAGAKLIYNSLDNNRIYAAYIEKAKSENKDPEENPEIDEYLTAKINLEKARFF